MNELRLPWLALNDMQMQALEFPNHARRLNVAVFGLIGNSVADTASGKERTRVWKIAVAKGVMASRGPNVWPIDSSFAITIGFRFFLPAHGNQLLDIENFMKPTLDALAAGLFAPFDQGWEKLARWNFDDSRFQHVLTHRLADATTPAEEGAMLCVSAVA